jgi:hypothetical protein
MPVEDSAAAFRRFLIQLKEDAGRFIEITDMRRSVDATDLSLEDMGPAFALIQALHPSLNLESWRRFVAPLIGTRPGRARLGWRAQRNGLSVRTVCVSPMGGRALSMSSRTRCRRYKVVIRTILKTVEAMAVA